MSAADGSKAAIKKFNLRRVISFSGYFFSFKYGRLFYIVMSPVPPNPQ